MKRLVVDLDGTLTLNSPKLDYAEMPPNLPLINKLREYKNDGFEILIVTARNMRTYGGNIGKINIETLPKIIDWLERHKVPYDEIHVGKPWCGEDGFYVDDKSIRPSEFLRLTNKEISSLLNKE